MQDHLCNKHVLSTASRKRGKQPWHSAHFAELLALICRTAPGLINEKLCGKFNLIYQEVTLVMTDVEGSTELWDWYEQRCS